MNNDEAQFDKIERYLRGELSEEENLAMQKAIAEDPDLAQELEFQQLELDAMDLILEEKLRNQMANWKQSPPPAPPSAGTQRKTWWWWPTLTLVAISLLVWFNWPFNQEQEPPTRDADHQEDPNDRIPPTREPNETPENPRPPIANDDKLRIKIPEIDRAGASLAMATYELPEDLNGTLKSPEEGITSPLDPGLKAFLAKDYGAAIAEFNKISASVGEEVYLRSQELLGHAYFKSKQYPRAAQVFSVLAQNQNQDFSILRQDAEWYLILSLLPNYSTNRERIEQLLIPILKPENYHSHQKQAEDLQQKILTLSK